MVTSHRVETLEELRSALTELDKVNIVGQNSKSTFRLELEEQRGTPVQVGMAGIVEFHPQDQVIVVKAGTLLPELLGELRETGQTLPLPMIKELWPAMSGYPGTVGGSISMNLPHALQAQCGSWRDWVLGVTAVLADGRVVRTGSQAVKNVAGYDAHKLFIGARGTLAVLAEVTLKTFPVSALPEPEVQLFGKWDGEPDWIQRVLPSEFDEAVRRARGRLLGADRRSSTFWCAMEPEVTGIQFTDDWFVRSGYVSGCFKEFDEATAGLMRRTKDIFDPTHKLNPAEMGIF